MSDGPHAATGRGGARAPRLALACALLALALGTGACGSGSTGTATVDPPPTDDGGGVPPLDGAAVWSAAGCETCHGQDGSGGFGPSLSCYPADGLDAYVRSGSSPHTGGVRGDLTDAELDAMEVFLADGCTANVPASHTDARQGVFHRPSTGDPSVSCTPCHGPNLEGHGTVPSCASCHDAGGSPTCSGCHTVAQDNGDGVPVDGRRAVVGEFSLQSHHLGDGWTDADCQVCHEMSAHRQGIVRLRDVDDPTSVYALGASPLSNADAAAGLEGFCLACHDADGAAGSAPFSDGVMPTPVDGTAWQTASHGAGQITCMGDGVSFGCHATGHGSGKQKLLARNDWVSVGPSGDTTRAEEGFCYACHTDGGAAATDIEAEFERTSHHVIASDEQGTSIELECTSCHDPHTASPSALLTDPDQGGTWTGTLQGFCLTCHDGSPPSGVSFPATSSGTGWDKSSFANTTHAAQLGADSCADCHEPHGAAYAALLPAEYVVAQTNQAVAGDYAACWACHSSSNILNGSNDFEDLHKKHVMEEDTACVFCHDVHGPWDAGERGLINFAFARAQGWGPSYPGSTTNSSAFTVNASLSRGYCLLTCHQESHGPESYTFGN